MQNQKEVFIFDLDGTLAESKAPLTDDMANALGKLLKTKKVCVISGGNFNQFKLQVIDRLEEVVGVENFKNLYIQPTSGEKMYAYENNTWKEIYALHLNDAEKNKIRVALEEVLAVHPFAIPQKLYGDQIEDRDSQITYSALGQNAPVEEKKAWDPDQSKRKTLADELQAKLPDLEVRSGGLTSIDIVKKGMDKAYGIRQLSEYLKIPISNMTFVGDAIYEGGNDFSATTTGVDCVKVKNPIETLFLVESWTL